ncbi:hypothetical protein F5Y15DRAFT_94709 [Xylariaceae sp. FL0016]|nr:hypothetical protein F5Y15DRAFT_94709 [Xylariaceae sp. FL0016]
MCAVTHIVSIFSTPQSSAISVDGPLPENTPSCYIHDSDPDEGLSERYCVCDETRTLTFISFSPGAPENKRDALAAAVTFTKVDVDTQPGLTTMKTSPSRTIRERDITVVPDFGPDTTDTMWCEVCSPVDAYGDKCTNLTGCSSPAAYVTVEDWTAPVLVGTLTGLDLYTSVTSVIIKLCPMAMASGSKSFSAHIKHIAYIGGRKPDGKR